MDNTRYGQSYAGKVLFACLAVSLILCFFSFQTTLDDALISFRYARNLYEGYGLGIWNPGEPPVEGMSSLLWVLLLALFRRLGVSYFVSSKIIGLVSMMLLPTMCIFAYLRQSHRAENATNSLYRGYLVAAAIFAVYFPIPWYAVSGMETIFFAAQLLFLILLDAMDLSPRLDTFLAILVSASITLTRPEGVLLAVMVGAYRVLTTDKRSQGYISIATATITCVSLTAFRMMHYGDPVPNTYYAKGAGGIHHLILGAKYILRFLECAAPVVVLLATAMFLKARALLSNALVRALFVIVLIYTLYAVKVGGDSASAFPMFRHYVHIAAVWILLAGFACAHLQQNLTRAIALGVVVALATDALMIVKFREPVLGPHEVRQEHGFFHLEPEDAVFIFLDRYADTNTVSAASLAGRWGFYLNGRIIDVLGLNNRYIAHHGSRKGGNFVDSKTDMSYVMAQRPDIIDGYMNAQELASGKCPYEVLTDHQNIAHPMLSNPIFQNEYVFVENAPYTARYERAIFLKKSFALRHQDGSLKLRDVTDTVLYTDPACMAAAHQ